MDTYESDCLKSEESGGVISLYNNLKSVTKLLRIVEICIVLVFLSWTSTRLPFAVKITADYFRQLITVIISPMFTFLVCNAIVLTLFLNAGGFIAGQSPVDFAIEYTDDDPYNTDFSNPDSNSLVSDPHDVVEYVDKETIYEESKKTVNTGGGDYDSPVKLLAEISEVAELKTKEMTRSQWEKLNLETVEEDTHRELRRSETERWRKVANPGEIPEKTVYVVDELSNEEFQQTIETFIAKQIKFRQQEKLAIVVSSHA